MRQVLPGQIVRSFQWDRLFADAVLKYALSVGADTGVLLTIESWASRYSGYRLSACWQLSEKSKKDIFNETEITS